MRTQLFVAFAMSSLVACGGDDAPVTPDAKVYMDAAPDTAPVCGITGPLGQLSFGTMQMRASGDWFQSPTSGPLMGRTIFFIGAGLPGSTSASADVLSFQVIKPETGDFPTGSAINFEPSPTSTTVVANSYLLADYNSASKTSAQVLWAGSGSITITAIGEGDGDMITGSVAATSYREINQMTGADVAGGCTLDLMGVNFALTQMAAPFAPDKLSSDEFVLTPDDEAFLRDQVDRLSTLRGQQ